MLHPTIWLVWVALLLTPSLSFVLSPDQGSEETDVTLMVQDVRRQKDAANRIIQLAVNGTAKGQLYGRLARFVDRYGNRMAGTQNLENSIEYLMLEMKADKLENVHGEPVRVPHWVRGEESAMLMKPRRKKLSMLGLGYSIATPPGGITAQALVVKSFEELERRADEAVGKIIVFNQDWISYGQSGKYRFYGAARAAAVGGVASLIRSLTPFSINTPHTGVQMYNDSVPKIPTACITVEDAEMLWRMAQRGETIEISLHMSAQNLPKVLSRNVVSEIVGSTYPEQIVLVSGHIDSWDVGQGAMDDGAGALLGWQALSLMRQLGLRPKRTVRSVMWTAEELGLVGSKGYFEQHKNDTINHVLVMESDMGTFRPRGLLFGGNNASITVMKEVLQLLAPINATHLDARPTDKFEGGDIDWWIQQGVPGAVPDTENEKYFYFHHTEGDTMEVLDTDELDLCAALWAVVAYTVANLEDVLPRNINIH